MALELELSFDELTGDALDSSGNGRTLTISTGNFSGRVAGLHSTSGFQQTSTGTTIGPTLGTALQTASRTTMFWLRVNASGTYWIDEYYNAANDTGVWGLLYLSGTLRWRVKNAANTPFDITITPDDGVWHHIAAVFDGAKLWVYRDGTLVNAGGTAVSGGLMTADTFRFMESTGSAATIEDFRHYSTALTQSEISTLMALPAGTAPADAGTLDGSFTSVTAAMSGQSVPADPGTLVGSFSSTSASMTANGIADGVLSGSFSSPSAAIAVTATAEVTVQGTFAAPTTVIAGSGTAVGQISGSFASVSADLTGGTPAPDGAALSGQFAATGATFSARSGVDVSMIGTFSIPAFTVTGGVRQPDRDILFIIGPGGRPATSIAAGPPRISVAQDDFQRTEIGA